MGISHTLTSLLTLAVVAITINGSIIIPTTTTTSVNLYKTPPSFSSSNSASFVFEVLEEEWNDVDINCKLDNYSYTNCEESKEINYNGLLDGYHAFEVCTNGSQFSCATYNWTVDTVSPTASVSVASPFTNVSNALVNICFSEPCKYEGGFQCLSANHCSIFVYGAAKVLSSTLKVIKPDLQYSIVVSISSDVEYGRIVIAMAKNFCTDASGNRFTRTANSSFFLHFDRRKVSVNMRTLVPEKVLLIDKKMRTVEATNRYQNLRLYLHFSSPVLNSSSEILGVLQTSSGVLLPANTSSTLGNRRFGFIVRNLLSISVVTIRLETNSIISRQGTPVSPTEPIIFLYDVKRPSVKLTLSSSSTSRSSREHNVSVVIKFEKPVFDFNSSALVISGGHMQGFRKISRSFYTAEIKLVDSKVLSIKVPENITRDVAGNWNLESNLLLVKHNSVPTISSILSFVTTVTFMASTLASTLVSISTGTLRSFGALSRTSSDPSQNLIRIAYHLQVFAQSKWLSAFIPVEFYEFCQGIEWIVPYFRLPWEPPESRNIHSFSTDSTHIVQDQIFTKTFESTIKIQKFWDLDEKNWGFSKDTTQYGTPLTAMEYRTIYENQNLKPEAGFIPTQSHISEKWDDFGRNMFWLAIIGGGLTALHILILLILKLRRRNSDKNNSYGLLEFPRFEIFLTLLALPCICQASTSMIKGGTTGVILSSLMLGITSILLTILLLFTLIGITMAKHLQYKEVRQKTQKHLHWYESLLRVLLSPTTGNEPSNWTWKDQPNSINLTTLGPLFEDLRGPSSNTVNETKDADKSNFIQRIPDNLRIYYTFLESVKRVSVGIVVGVMISNTCSSSGGYDSHQSKHLILMLLCITSFQLLFLMFNKPFIRKKVQFAEIVSLVSEVGIFTTCFVIPNHMTESSKTRIGYFMLGLFMVGYSMSLLNEWYALYIHILWLSPDGNSLCLGLRMGFVGVLLVFFPARWLSSFSDKVSSGGSMVSSRSGDDGGGNERSWVRQLRKIAKDSFGRDDSRIPKDPSSSLMGAHLN